jgi:hypothetical protein
VRYVTVVPRTTKTLPARRIQKLTRLSSGRRLIRVAGGPLLKRGDVLAAGVGPNTPHGLLVKVVAVRPDGAAVVKQTTLLAAVPTGQLDAQRTLTSRDIAPGVARKGLRPDASGGGVGASIDGKLGKDCTGAADATASGSVSVQPSFALEAAWNPLHGVTSARLTATLAETAQVQASIKAAVKCSGSRDLFKDPITFATFVVDVGPIPVVLQPQLQITFDGHVNVRAAVTTSATQQLAITSGLQYTRAGGVSPVESVTNTHNYRSPTLTASGDVTASVNPEVDLLIDGVGGPEVGLTGGLELDANTSATPWWTLEAFLNGNAGITVPILHIDQRVQLASKTWQLAHATTAGVGGGGGGGGGGGAHKGALVRTSGIAGFWTEAAGFTCPIPSTGHDMHLEGIGPTNSLEEPADNNGGPGSVQVQTGLDTAVGTYRSSVECVETPQGSEDPQGNVVASWSFSQTVTGPSTTVALSQGGSSGSVTVTMSDPGGCGTYIANQNLSAFLDVGGASNAIVAEAGEPVPADGNWPPVTLDFPNAQQGRTYIGSAYCTAADNSGVMMGYAVITIQ